METINWKERADFLLTNCTEKWNCNINLFHRDDVIGAMLQFAKEVHDKACEDQKHICSNEQEGTIEAEYCLNSPNAKFE